MHTGEDASEKEIYASWAIFILIMLLIVALFTSYLLQQKKVTAIHETVASIFAGALTPAELESDIELVADMMARHDRWLDSASCRR